MGREIGKPEPPRHREALRGEGLVQFDGVEIVNLHPETRKKLRYEAVEEKKSSRFSRRWDLVYLINAVKPENKWLEKKSVAEIAKIRKQDPTSACFDLIFEEGNFIHGVHHTMNEDDVKSVMRVPWVSIGSDGSALNLQFPGKPHPRSFGTNRHAHYIVARRGD